MLSTIGNILHYTLETGTTESTDPNIGGRISIHQKGNTGRYSKACTLARNTANDASDARQQIEPVCHSQVSAREGNASDVVTDR